MNPLSSEKQRLISLIELYEQELKDFKIESLKKRVELQKRKKELDTRLKEMLPIVEEFERRKQELSARLNELRSRLSESRQARDLLLKKREETFKQLETLQPLVQGLQQRASELERQVQELERQKSEIVERIAYLKKEIPRRKELQARLENASNRLTHLKSEKERLEEQVKEKQSVLELLNRLQELQHAVKTFVKSLDWLSYTLGQVSLDEIAAPLDMENRERVVKALQYWEKALTAYKGGQHAELFRNLVECIHELLDLYLEYLGLMDKVKDPTNLKEKIIILTNYAVPLTSRHMDTVNSFLERMERGIEVLPKTSTVIEILQTFERNILVLCSLPKELRFSQ